MRLIFLAVFLAIFPLSILSHANAETADALNAGGTVKILGYQIPTPVQVDGPIEWEAVRDHVPAALRETPPSPMTAREIYNEVNRLMRAGERNTRGRSTPWPSPARAIIQGSIWRR